MGATAFGLPSHGLQGLQAMRRLQLRPVGLVHCYPAPSKTGAARHACRKKKAPVLFGPAQPTERKQLQPRRTKSMRYRGVKWTVAHQSLKPAVQSARTWKAKYRRSSRSESLIAAKPTRARTAFVFVTSDIF